MKVVKALLIGLGGLFVLVIILAAVSMNDKTPDSNSSTTQTTEQQSTETSIEKITISNTKYTYTGAFHQIIGEAKNNDNVKHSMSIKATFYDADGKIMGTATGFLNDVAPGETKTFNLLGSEDVKGHATFKVQVDSLL